MNALYYLAKYVEQLPVGKFTELGYVFSRGEYQLTRSSTAPLLNALHFIIDAVLQLRKARSVRAANGARKLARSTVQPALC